MRYLGRFVFLAAVYLLSVECCLADPLIVAREAELQTLTTCPTTPTLGVINSSLAGPLITELTNYPGAPTLVERARLESATGELCLGPAFDPSASAPGGGQLFAMYLAEVAFDMAAAAPKPLSIRIIRSDSGEIIYDHTHTLSSGSLVEIESAVSSSLSAITEAVSTNPYECSDTFDAVITEDHSLRCNGDMGMMGSYKVSSDFTIEFTLDGFDYSNRNSVQLLQGSARILPAAAKTTITRKVVSTRERCSYTLSIDQVLSIKLDSNKVAASYELLIPANTTEEWSFSPSIEDKPYLFSGDSLMANVHTTTVHSGCTGSGGTDTKSQDYKHYEANNFQFGLHKLKPLCEESYPIPTAFTRTPNLGVPGLLDITPNCSKRSAQARFSFRRSFDD